MIVFDSMVANMLSNKKCNPIVTEVFIGGTKINVTFVFITQSCFTVRKEY